MKIAIITICDPIPNFGNRLQNYAVQKVYRDMGMETITYAFQGKIISTSEKIKYFVNYLSKFKLSKSEIYWKTSVKKAIKFDEFNKKYIAIQYIDSIAEIGAEDFYSIGSDQVWNPAWYDKDDLKKNMFLLTFAPDDKKICFSPSFGVSNLPSNWIPWFKQQLSSFPKLSVREEAGAKIIKDLTGKDAEVLIDPTLMLDKDDWKRIEKKPALVDIDTPYILTYFLGEISEQIQKNIEYICREKKLTVHHLMKYDESAVYASGPSEFVYLIEHAELILTDSFHACVFAFLFHKPFLVYGREGKENDMFSRMDTLFEKLDLKRKFVEAGKPYDLTSIFECDYSVGFSRLAKEREKVLDFLKKSIAAKNMVEK